MAEAERTGWGEFLDDLVHELRAPLTAVGGYAALLAGDDLPDEARDAAAIIEAQAGRLGSQLELLLEVARLWSGRTVLHREHTNLAALLHTLGNQHAIPVEAPRNIWAQVDAPLVRRAVSELVTNAVQHGAPPAAIVLRRTERQVGIQVEDGGAGVPDRCIPAIGRRPFMAGGDEARRTGRGLGLVFAAAVAEAHGGRLTYARAGGLSQFTLALPSE